MLFPLNAGKLITGYRPSMYIWNQQRACRAQRPDIEDMKNMRKKIDAIPWWIQTMHFYAVVQSSLLRTSPCLPSRLCFKCVIRNLFLDRFSQCNSAMKLQLNSYIKPKSSNDVDSVERPLLMYAVRRYFKDKCARISIVQYPIMKTA